MSAVLNGIEVADTSISIAADDTNANVGDITDVIDETKSTEEGTNVVEPIISKFHCPANIDT